MIRPLILLALLPALASVPANAADPVIGQASVVDGDTLEIDGQRLRLHGIDAPERAQTCAAGGKSTPCGQQAADALAGRIAQQTVTCEPTGRDQDGLEAAVCSAGGEEINGWMVSQGMALAYRRFSNDYVRREKRAAKQKTGIWRGYFVKPWDWRRGRRLTKDKVFEEGACTIKGNITRGGSRVYHIPGGQYYGPARIDESNGERWFCSEAEARAAGWKKSKR